jgi:hypothetical protein
MRSCPCASHGVRATFASCPLASATLRPSRACASSMSAASSASGAFPRHKFSKVLYKVTLYYIVDTLTFENLYQPNNTELEERFTEMLDDIKNEHSSVQANIARGLQELSEERTDLQRQRGGYVYMYVHTHTHTHTHTQIHTRTFIYTQDTSGAGNALRLWPVSRPVLPFSRRRARAHGAAHYAAPSTGRLCRCYSETVPALGGMPACDRRRAGKLSKVRT